MLDRERKIELTLNAMSRFKELTGRNIMNSGDLRDLMSNLSSDDITALIWSCLDEDDEDRPTLAQIGKRITLDNLGEATKAISIMFTGESPADENPFTLSEPSSDITSASANESSEDSQSEN